MGRISRNILALALLGVAIALMVPFFAHGRNGDKTFGRMHMLWIALQLYSQDEGAYPDMSTPDSFKRALYPANIKDKTAFISDSDGQPIIPNLKLSREPLAKHKTDQRLLLWTARPDRFGRRIVEFEDGDGRFLTESQWRDFLNGVKPDGTK